MCGVFYVVVVFGYVDFLIFVRYLFWFDKGFFEVRFLGG